MTIEDALLFIICTWPPAFLVLAFIFSKALSYDPNKKEEDVKNSIYDM